MAKRRWRSDQKIVDLAIVLESLFTPEGADQIALAVRTRGAWLLGTTYEERRKVYDLINVLYDTRSRIVHTGRMPLRKGVPQWDRANIIPEATRLCERAVDLMIEAPTEPDSTTIVLGQADKNQ
jgi:hypothetical protein